MSSLCKGYAILTANTVFDNAKVAELKKGLRVDGKSDSSAGSSRIDGNDDSAIFRTLRSMSVKNVKMNLVQFFNLILDKKHKVDPSLYPHMVDEVVEFRKAIDKAIKDYNLESNVIGVTITPVSKLELIFTPKVQDSLTSDGTCRVFERTIYEYDSQTKKRTPKTLKLAAINVNTADGIDPMASLCYYFKDLLSIGTNDQNTNFMVEYGNSYIAGLQSLAQYVANNFVVSDDLKDHKCYVAAVILSSTPVTYSLLYTVNLNCYLHSNVSEKYNEHLSKQTNSTLQAANRAGTNASLKFHTGMVIQGVRATIYGGQDSMKLSDGSLE